MTDSIRSALERLVFLDGCADETSPGWCKEWGEAIAAARAALAKSDGPAVPESREPASVVGESIDENCWQWYTYCPEEGLEMYSDRRQAQSAAQSIMGSYEVAAHSDGWHEDMELVSWGMLVPVEQAQVVERKTAEPDDEFDEWVKYELRPVRWGHQPASLVAGAPGPSMEDVGPLIAWLTEQACQAADASQPADAGMLTWAAQVIGERVNEDAPVAGEVAEQQGEGPSDEELTQFLFDNFRGPIEFICDAEEEAHVMIRNHIKFARAVLARWGHQPTPQPLSPSAQAADDSTLRDAALLALTTLEGWSNYDQWVWPISAMEQVRRGTTEAIAALRMALSRFAPPTEGEVAKPQKASTAELTANIQIDTSPECLQRLFDGLNAAVKPDGGYRAQTTDDPMVQTGCEQMVGVEWWLPQHGCDSLENTLDAIKGRILTAVFKWWPTATVSATQPPAEGEVGELMDRLRRASDGASAMGWEQDSWAIARAAELLQQQQAKIESLEQQLETERMRVVACGIIATSDTPFSAAKNRNCHPDYWSASADDIARQIDELMRLRAQQTPVPVSERLPGPGEMDGSLVWCGSQAAGLPYWEWCLDDIRHPGSSGYTHWLPANTPALPTALPQGEVEK